MNKDKFQIVRKKVRDILESKLLSESQEIKMKHNIPVPADIMKIKDLLKKRGHKLFVVGGAVRDALLGKTPKDYDLATDALPDTIQEILNPFYKTLETGKAFGIINVLTPSGEYEIATFRKDIGAGRRPDAVEFTTIDQDVKRRDLTINALFYDIDTEEVVDLVGGIEDLKNGVVRTVGSAEERFGEDRLRILRAIRFAGRFGSELDPAVDAALKKDSSLEGISGERIRDEFLKGIKSAKSVKQFLEMLQRYNLFQWIFGPLVVKERGMQSLDLIEERDVPVLLAYLLVDNDVDTLKRELNALKYSTDEVAQIYFLVSFKNLTPETVFKFKKAQVNSKLSNEQIHKFGQWMKMDMALVDAFLNFKLSVTGKELMDQGFIGKELGAEMEKRETQNFLSNL
jgi:tRNA nucleotidyltransferase/poly(A) polymerase